jgi:hypothetical protein
MMVYQLVVSVEPQDLKNVAKSSLLVIFLACTTCIFGKVAEEGIKQISLNDRICMKVFFDQAIKYNQAAHVLFFNNKPMCITCLALKHKDKTFKDVLALRGWHAFKKNEPLFPHPKFIFSQKIFESGDDCQILHIYIINKESLIQCLDEHLSLFKEILGTQFSSTQFIVKLEEGQSLLSLLNDDEMLLGVLLGYGKEAAAAFKKRRTQCTQTFAPAPTETYRRIDLEQPKGCKIQPVVFMGNPQSTEIKALMNIYELELEAIAKTYGKAKDSLKIVLEKLCEE